jgi:hypothetical protein
MAASKKAPTESEAYESWRSLELAARRYVATVLLDDNRGEVFRRRQEGLIRAAIDYVGANKRATRR